MHGFFLFRFHERFLQEPPGTVIQVQFEFAFLQSDDGFPRLLGSFLDVLPADLFQSALRGAKLHLQLPNVGGSGGLVGWGRQHVQVGTILIA